MSVPAYLQLDRPKQLAILKELQATKPYDLTFRADTAPALQFIMGKATELSETARLLANAMNQKAQEVLRRDAEEAARLDFEKDYKHWKAKVDVLTGLFPIANGMTQGIMFSGLAMGGLSLWSFKSSKCLAAANGCAALALLTFSGVLEKYTLALHMHHDAIDDLKISNRREFSSKIDGNYEAVEKSSTVLRSYFGARRQVLTEQTHCGLQLLKQDLAAIKAMKSYSFFFLLPMDSETSDSTCSDFSTTLPEIKQSLPQIKAFFEKLERTLNQGKKLAALGTFIGLGYLYCAYVSRAYLMVIAGLTFSLMNGVLCGVAHSYEIGAAKIRNAQAHDLLILFNSHVAGKLIPKAMDEASLQQAIVIPLEKILKPVPI